MLGVAELLTSEVGVEVFAGSIVGSFVASLAIGLLAVEVDAEIFAGSIVGSFVASLAGRPRFALIAEGFTATGDELEDSCKRSDK